MCIRDRFKWYQAYQKTGLVPETPPWFRTWHVPVLLLHTGDVLCGHGLSEKGRHCERNPDLPQEKDRTTAVHPMGKVYAGDHQTFLFIGSRFQSCSLIALLVISRVLFVRDLSLIHISEPTRRTPISYAVFCLKKKKRNNKHNKKKNKQLFRVKKKGRARNYKNETI